jgi:HK97 family phage prohead protease
METKVLSFDAEIKAEGQAGEITGYGSVFGNVDSYGDIVDSKAFNKSLSKRGLPVMLWQHDQTQPIGVWESAEPDERGLKLKGRLFIDEISKAKEAYALVKNGAIKGLSIGFMTKKSEAGKEGERVLTEVDLLEVSLVTFPANEKAKVTSVKSLPQTERDFEKFLRDAGFSNEASKAIVAKGFRSHIREPREVAQDEVVNGLKKAISILQEIAK